MKRLLAATLLFAATSALGGEVSQYVYVVRPARAEMVTQGPTEQEMAVLGRHLQYLNDLAASGRVLIFGRTQNNDASTFGIVVFEAESPAEAEKTMNGDPAVAAGIMKAELFPYQAMYVRGATGAKRQ
jgi:uncharacterized protein YciI